MTEFFNRVDEKPRRRELRNAMPSAEVVLWSKLKARQLLSCKFRRQYGVGPFVIDFYSPEIKLGIELEGTVTSPKAGVHTITSVSRSSSRSGSGSFDS